MSIRKMMTLAGLALAVAALTPTSALAKAGGTDRPLMGSSSGTSCTNVVTGDFTNDSTGIVTHVGEFTSHAEGSGAFTGPNTYEGSGTVTLVAANGDQVYADITITSTDASNPVHTDLLVFTFTGGTGRFADGSGTATQILTVSTFSFDGTTACATTEGPIAGQVSY